MTETASPKQFRPLDGGSYTIGKDGKVIRSGGTLGPLDPKHPHNAPPAADSKGGRK